MSYNQLLDQAQKLSDEEFMEFLGKLLDIANEKESDATAHTGKPRGKISRLEAKKRPFGTMKGGIVYMADDFDEPLEDLNDYMYAD